MNPDTTRPACEQVGGMGCVQGPGGAVTHSPTCRTIDLTGKMPCNAAAAPTRSRRPLRVVVVPTAVLPADPTREIDEADVVAHLSLARIAGTSVLLANICILRSTFGDPFRHEAEIDLAFTDTARREAQEKADADELSAAKAVIAKHGLATYRPSEKPKTLDGADL